MNEQLEFRFEEWRVIDGFEGFYEVSNFGRVRSLARKVNTGRNGWRHQPSQIIKGVINQHGYLQLTLCSKGKRCSRPVHRLVAEAFLGPRPPGLDVDHKDCNQLNNSAWNLRYVTRSENVQRAFDLGRKIGPRGENCGTAKLRKEDVIEIRRLRMEGMQTKQIASLFKISSPTVSEISNRRKWRHI